MNKDQIKFSFHLIKDVSIMLLDGVTEQMVEYLLKKKYGYLLYVDNWHKHPKISNIMCKMGRHDYEFDRLDEHGGGLLYCFYCEKVKSSKHV